MKKKIIFFTCFVVCIFAIPKTINAQVNLERYDCFSLKANSANEHDVHSQMSFTYSLEKMIAPSVWSEKKKKFGKEEEITFENLSAGFYRVSYFVSEMKKRTSNLKTNNQVSQIPTEKRTLISEVIEIKDCNGKNPPTISAPFQEKELLIYPNPAKDEVFIQIPNHLVIDNTTLQLKDISGRLIKELNIKSSLETINLSDVLSGLYYVSLKNGEHVFNHKKLIVTKN